jgi:hypothetical protein
MKKIIVLTTLTTIAIVTALLTASPGNCATYDNYVRIYNIQVTQISDYPDMLGGPVTYGFSFADMYDFYMGTMGSNFSEKWRLIDDWDNPVWFDQSWWTLGDPNSRPDFSDYYAGPFIYSDLVDFTSNPGYPWEVRTIADVEIYWNSDAMSRMMLSTFSDLLFLGEYGLTTRIEFDYEANITDNAEKLGVVSCNSYEMSYGEQISTHAVFGAGQHSGHASFEASSYATAYYPSIGFALGTWSSNIIVPEPSILLIGLSAFLIRRKK